MLKQLKIDKSVYLVDDEDKSYRFFKRNPNWNKLTMIQNLKNKKLIDGYTRMLRNDTTKKFIFKEKKQL